MKWPEGAGEGTRLRAGIAWCEYRAKSQIQADPLAVPRQCPCPKRPCALFLCSVPKGATLAQASHSMLFHALIQQEALPLKRE